MNREQTSIPNIEFVTATGRYDESRSPIDLIVLHSTAGTLQSAISLFGSTPQPGKGTSAHYIVDNDGKLYQGLEEYYTAYHCGDYPKNQRSIGIEHVDNGADVKLHTDAQYDLSARLVADICKFYGFPCDAAHVVPHSSIVPTACPNGLDVNRIINKAKEILGVPTTPDTCAKDLADLKIVETGLRDAIRGKDELLKVQEVQIGKLSEELKQCQLTNQSSVELQNKLTKVQNQYKKLLLTPSKFQTDMLLKICEKLDIQL